MQQQMQFSRPTWQQHNSSRKVSNNDSLHHVAFAVSHSPVLYHNNQLQVGKSPDAAHLAKEPQVQQRQPRTRHGTQTQQKRVRTGRSAASKEQSRRPGWDDDVKRGETLFDASLKKSLLFQPKAGEKTNDENAQAQNVLPRKSASKQKKMATARTPVRYRSGPSSVYAQQRQNMTRRPQRKGKNFVRQNIEHFAGRPQFKWNEAHSRRREDVYDRLSAPRVSKALLRTNFRSVESKNDSSPRPVTSPSLRPALSQTPVLTIDTPSPDKHDSRLSETPLSDARRARLGRVSPFASPQQSRQSLPQHHSLAPCSYATNRSTNGGSRTERYDNYPARVFGVLDRDNAMRIGVSQILQGLRLLGLPATHNQISDYVYLIHEGRHNTIDLEEWEILVGTLDAASRPSSQPPRSAYTVQDSLAPSRSMRAIPEHSPYSSKPPSCSPLTRDEHPTNAVSNQLEPESSTQNDGTPRHEEEHYSGSIWRADSVVDECQHVPDDDPYLEEIQNRIEGMFEKAQATAALRWAPGPGNNQCENDPDHSRSDSILKHAASVVYSLRASLFPLVHQAEATLREIQQRHGSQLSLFLPPGDMAAVAQNSDVLASAILDDLLLDTVQLLNDDDKQQSCRQLEVHHADHLDSILARIQDIEREEDNMINQGFALGYKILGSTLDLPKTSCHSDLDQVPAKSAQHDGAHQPELILPLEVVMNIDVSNGSTCISPRPKPEVAADVDSSERERCELGHSARVQRSIVEMPVRTSILQGKRLQFIERRKHKFEHHRRLVESSLAETGMTQCAVIEILEDMLLDDLVGQAAEELNSTVVSMSDTLLTNLL